MKVKKKLKFTIILVKREISNKVINFLKTKGLENYFSFYGKGLETDFVSLTIYSRTYPVLDTGSDFMEVGNDFYYDRRCLAGSIYGVKADFLNLRFFHIDVNHYTESADGWIGKAVTSINQASCPGT